MTLEDRCGADVAAYALGALDSDEARAFERHLATCAVCPEELASFRGVVDGIAASAPPVPAPRSLKRAVMAEIARPESSPERVRAPRPTRRGVRVPLGFGGLVFGGGLAFAVAAVVVAVLLLPGRMGNRVVQADVNGSGTAALRISGGHAEMVVRHFAAPPTGRIYEVWLQRRGHRLPSPNALFSVDRDGDASVEVPGSLYGVSKVLVTSEPAPHGTRTRRSSPPTCSDSPCPRRAGVIRDTRNGVYINAGPATAIDRSAPHMVGLDNPLHIALVLVVVLMVFGAKRLPEMGKGLGEGMRGFKSALSGEEPQQQISLAKVDETARQPVAAQTAPQRDTTPAA